MSLLVTSPNLAYVVAPAERSHLTRPLWITIALAALPGLLYQNSGYIQFGYRFSLDYMIYLMMLLASIATWSSRTTTRSSPTGTTELTEPPLPAFTFPGD